MVTARRLHCIPTAALVKPGAAFLERQYASMEGVSTVGEVEQRLDAAQSLGAVGIKVMVEQGFTPFGSSWPIHSAEILDAIASGAKRRKLPIYVHATSEDEYRIAVSITFTDRRS